MTTKNQLFYFLLTILLFGLASCKRNEKIAEAKKIVAEWIGKEIILPIDIECTYWGSGIACPDSNTPYKVLLYTDSTGCTSCKLQLYKWNTLIEEAMESISGKVSFHFYFHPKDEKELQFLLKRDNFNQTVYIDRENKLYAENKLPDDMNYQCFLLDKDNKVLLVGNPTLNFSIWDLYKQTIIGEENTKRKNTTYIQ